MRQFGSVTILDVSGRLVMETGLAFREEMEQLQADHKKILVNFENVTYMDSSGLGNWLATFPAAHGAGVRVKYILNQKIQELLDISRFY